MSSQDKTEHGSAKPSALPFAIHGSTIECHSDHGIEITGDVAAPLHLSTTFVAGVPESQGQVYSRMHNVTRRRVEAVLGAVEGGQAVTYASGQSAATAFIQCIKPRRVYLDAGYHGAKGAFKLWSERLHAGGGNVEFLTLEQCKQLHSEKTHELAKDRPLWRPAEAGEERALDLIWVESPNNPYTTLIDIEWFSELAARTGACLLVDGTLASPARSASIRTWSTCRHALFDEILIGA